MDLRISAGLFSREVLFQRLANSDAKLAPFKYRTFTCITIVLTSAFNQ
jgi:hypothetical protein